MTLGEKIRQARYHCGLSQEQLAQKLCVSRSAVAKWETDKGMPDIENLKVLSKLLSVSLDQLLDESLGAEDFAIRERYSLASYGRGCKKVKKDRAVRERFPDARIHTLLGQQDLTKAEEPVDNVLVFCTQASFGIEERVNGAKNPDKEFYLVEQDDYQLFVTVTDAFIETRRLKEKFTGNQFALGKWRFIKCNYELKREKDEY